MIDFSGLFLCFLRGLRYDSSSQSQINEKDSKMDSNNELLRTRTNYEIERITRRIFELKEKPFDVETFNLNIRFGLKNMILGGIEEDSDDR